MSLMLFSLTEKLSGMEYTASQNLAFLKSLIRSTAW